MAILTNVYVLPSRCDCGAPLSVRSAQPWCGGCGVVRLAQFDKAKHPRGTDGRFGSGQSGPKPPSAADTDPTIQRAMKWLTDQEREDMPRIVLQPHRPDGVGENVEGYHVPDYPVVYVGTWSDTWVSASRGDRDAEMKLAGVLIHEATHVTNGSSESAAYTAQIKALRRMGASELIIERVEQAKRTVARGAKR
jgi:hypothetical protein